jgi:hypothetical protein
MVHRSLVIEGQGEHSDAEAAAQLAGGGVPGTGPHGLALKADLSARPGGLATLPIRSLGFSFSCGLPAVPCLPSLVSTSARWG